MKKSFTWFTVIIMICLFVVSTNSWAIPAFARRYKISCSTCHAPFPKLKPYGDDFAGAGMILEEEEKDRDYIIAGDDLLRLNKDFPVAARFDAFAVYDEDKHVETDLETPWGLKLLSGGTLTKKIGYYFYFYMSERGEVAGIEDAYIHFDNIFNANLDIMLGQFQTSDPLMKRELRLTFEDYMIYGTRIGLSQTNLTYDRGIMLLYSIEKTGTDIVGLLVNGNGKGEADADKKFDNDRHKNFGVRIIQAIGDFMSIGGYYYLGKEEQDTEINDIVYWGPDLNIGVGPIEVTAQYLERTDSSPYFSAQPAEESKTKGTVVEVIYSPQLDRSRFFLTALYNKVESDLSDKVLCNICPVFLNYETATLSGTYLFARNFRFTAEFTHDLEKESNRFVLGIVSGF
ncbi:hypothetical protein JW935_09050 [candidate division KSB1 bacterium]|nr:hypothetical protein [candidate division KSB1 bacterium]